jgi:protein O-GlcNAc transferase
MRRVAGLGTSAPSRAANKAQKLPAEPAGLTLWVLSAATLDLMTATRQLFDRALTAQRAGHLEAAALDCAQLLEREPQHVDALHMLGLLRHQQGDVDEALRLLDSALAIAPGTPAILANRASLHLAREQFGAAQADAQQAAQGDPKSFGAWFNLGLSLSGLSRVAEAASAFALAGALRPQHARALLEWFSAAARSDQGAGLAERCHRPLPRLRDQRDLALRTAATLEQYGLANPAFALLAQLRAELPADAEVNARYEVEVHYRHACVLELRQSSDAALAAAQKLLAVVPTHRSTRILLASLLGERGETSAALAEYRLILQQVPDDAKAGSAYLIALQHDPDESAQSIAAAHFAWGARHAPSVGPLWPPQPALADPERALRIGWISPRFFAGLLETFFAPVLERLHGRGMAHVLYDAGAIQDATSARLRAAADAWHVVEGLDDPALCAQIRADRIDVLVDLSGHSPGNRLRALAARPAPVQVSWLDYFHSTGVAAIDVLLSDAVLSPAELASNYSERVVTLPSGRLCYTAPADAPDVAARECGPLRFTCFNRLSKINDEVLAMWAGVLNAVPDSVLKLKARALDDAGARAHFLSRCQGAGIDAGRLELQGYGTHVQTLAAYSDVDIALDPFPFSGCATSCDALWMGVPVITRMGQTMVSRQTASLLTSLGLPDLIVGGREDYVRCAQALAADITRRQSLRAQLRLLMCARLGDVGRHAGELEAALRQAWRSWCQAEAGA